MESTYKNPWFNPNNKHSGPNFYSTYAKPQIYKGYEIFHRINSTGTIASGSHVFDVVKDGACIGQYAGPNGARKFIDSITDGALND